MSLRRGRGKKERKNREFETRECSFLSLSFLLPYINLQADGADATTWEKCQLSDRG